MGGNQMKLIISSLFVIVAFLLFPQTGLAQIRSEELSLYLLRELNNTDTSLEKSNSKWADFRIAQLQKGHASEGIRQGPDLRISKEGPRMVYLHRPVVYKIIITNTGEGPAKAMEMVETLPANLDYVSSKPRGVFKPSIGKTLATVSWQFQEIPPKGKIEIDLTLRAKTLGRCRTSAKLLFRTTEPQQPPPLEAFADLEIRGVPAMHISTYDTEDPVEVGKTTVYVIEIRNEGTAPCTGVNMTSVIPEEMEFLKCEVTGASCKFEKGQVLFDTIPFLAPGEKLMYKIQCKAVKPGSAKHRAILKYDQFASPIINEEGTSVYQ
jgi:uncharacterized repeat protein (TIGR01451 family)